MGSLWARKQTAPDMKKQKQRNFANALNGILRKFSSPFILYLNFVLCTERTGKVETYVPGGKRWQIGLALTFMSVHENTCNHFSFTTLIPKINMKQ